MPWKDKEYGKKKKREYYLRTREHKLDHQKQYNIDNADKIKKYRAKNSEIIKKKKAEYYKNNKEKISIMRKIGRKRDKKKIDSYNRDYYHNNLERELKRSEIYRINNGDKIKEYRKNNKDKISHLAKLRRCRVRNAEGSHTLKQWNKLRELYNYTCPCCGKKEPFNQCNKRLTEDHINPIIKGGSNYIWNIQPLCGVCNSKKSTKTTHFPMIQVELSPQ